MLHLILGRSGYGKTTYLYQTALAMEHSGKRVFFLVPEQNTVTAERDLLNLAGNRINRYLEVINFSRLPDRVFRETGGISHRYIDRGGKHLVMASALRAIRPALTQYRDSADDPAFLSRALSQVEEFQNSGITPRLLENAAQTVPDDAILKNKLADFSAVYASYFAILSGGFRDPDDDLQRLSALLEETRFFEGCAVFIDGFYDFTKVQYDIIGRLMDSCDLYLSLLCDPAGEKDGGEYFHKTGKALRRVTALAEQCGCGVTKTILEENRRHTAHDLRYLEENITRTNPRSFVGECPSIRATRCETIYGEALYIARTIRSLIKSGARYSQIAVCARKIDEYAPFLEIAFERYGIPFHTTVRESMANRPLIVFLLSALELIDSAFYQPYMIRYLKCGLCPLEKEDQFLLETYLHTWNISGRLLSEDREWLMNPRGFVEQFEDRDREELRRINQSKETVLRPLRALAEGLSLPSLKEKLTALTDFLESSGVRRRLDLQYEALVKNGEYAKANEQTLVWNTVIHAFDQLYDVFGDCSIGRKQLLDYLSLLFSEYDMGALPEAFDQVQTGDAAFMRSGRIQYLFLAGFHEGDFPQVPESDGFFSEMEKKTLAELGVFVGESDAERLYDELFYFYLTVSSPSGALYLSYHTSALNSAGGAETVRNPSPFLQRIAALFPALAEEEFREEKALPMCREELLEYLTALYCDRRDRSEEYSPLLQYLRQRDPALFSRFEAIRRWDPRAPHRLRDTSPLKGDLRLSQTRYEAYRSCQYSYFLKYMLKLREEPSGEFRSAQIGSYVHKLLEEFFKKLLSAGLDIRTVSKARTEEMITESAGEYLRTIAPFLDQNSVRFQYLYDRISRFLTEIIRNIAEEFRRSDFSPLYVEESLGGENIPYYRIPLEDGSSLLFSGQIDRVDCYTSKKGETYLRVVDYKTHSAGKRLKLGDIVNGINVQLLVYLFAMWSQGVRIDGKMKKIMPAGVMYMPAVRPSLSDSREPDPDDLQKTLAKKLRRDGLFLDDPEILEAMEHGLSGTFLPFGSPDKPSLSLASLERLGRLMRFVESEFEKTAKQLKRGEIGVNPYLYGRCSCEYCPYRPVCRFENEGGRSYVMPKEEEAVQMIDRFENPVV